jgi:hypothetical protein
MACSSIIIIAHLKRRFRNRSLLAFLAEKKRGRKFGNRLFFGWPSAAARPHL